VAWKCRITLLALTAVLVLERAEGRGDQGTSGSRTGTVDGDLTLDGKSLGLRYAVAVSRPDVFDEKKEGFTVALTARPLPPGVIDSARIVESVDEAVKEGVVLHIGQNAYCKIVIRDRLLAGRELQNMGGFVCRDDSVTVWGPDRVEGTVMSAHKGQEEEIAQHRVRYTLHFNAPILKRFPLAGAAPNGHPAAASVRDAVVRTWRECEQAARSGDIQTFLRLSVEDRMKAIPREQLPMGLALAAALIPEKVEAGGVEVAGDNATLQLSGMQEGKTVYGNALLVRQKGEWKVDVFWKGASRP
jgi:hypothetical protein